MSVAALLLSLQQQAVVSTSSIGNVTSSTQALRSSGNDAAIAGTLTVGGNVVCAGTVAGSGGGMGAFRNRIINGDMRIEERPWSSEVKIAKSLVDAPVIPADRFVALATGWFHRVDRHDPIGIDVPFQRGPLANPQIITGIPLWPSDWSGPDNGINHAIAVVALPGLAPDTSSATAFMSLRQYIEGTNVRDLAWGTPAACAATLSFYVFVHSTTLSSMRVSMALSNIGGAGTGSGQPARKFVSASVVATNSWQRVTLSVPGDTAGAWSTLGGSVGVVVDIVLAAAGDACAPSASMNDAWQTMDVGVVSPYPGDISFLTSTATYNVAYLTGVQFEKGGLATPFEFRPAQVEEWLCQRYYETGSATNIVQVSGGYDFWLPQINYRTPKAVTPTVTLTSPSSGNGGCWDWKNNHPPPGSLAYTTATPASVSTENLNAFQAFVAHAPNAYSQGDTVAVDWAAEAEIS